MTTPPLFSLLDDSAARHPDKVAVEEGSVTDPAVGAITYGELARLSRLAADRLRRLGVRPGDRVGLYLRKSVDGVAAIFGALRAGAAYVPVDPGAPPARNAYILDDCSVRTVLVERRFAEALRAGLAARGPVPPLLVLDDVGGGHALRAALTREERPDPALPLLDHRPSPHDLAYILYTSGSTGKPKGVMLSHRNATSFVDWCSETFAVTAADRCSSHAPFHFDLSILDIYLALKHGATLVLIGEEIGKDPMRLARLIAGRRLSVWYSAPSILSLLVQHGGLDRLDLSAVRLVLFAGEVFPVKYLRALQQLLPAPRYVNLYGPTETNVCTSHEIPTAIPADRVDPYPIGRACSHVRTRVLGPDGAVVAAGQEGELCVAGAGVMQGYWNLPEQTARAFVTDPDGIRWYRTGDVVVETPGGDYQFLGRRDRMVKRRGYRVELGEIEAGLYRHPAVLEAAVVALADADGGVRIKAFLACRGGDQRPSIIELKAFCMANLPPYMIPDLFAFADTLPKTSTDKVDYQRLKEQP